MGENNLNSKEKIEVKKEVKKALSERIKSKAGTLKSEFKKQTATAIMAAFGLIIAFSWKDVITDLVGRVAFIKSHGLLVSAIILTIISILGILLVSKWAKSGEK